MIAKARGLTYRYPSSARDALTDVDLDVREGELALVTGPSAGGKSTLLRSLIGLVPQFYGGSYAGHVTVAGLDPARTPVRAIAAVAGLVFQEPEAQAVAETVDEDIAFGLEQRGTPRREMERAIDRSLRSVGAEHLRARAIATLSGGERQRVAIAAALALGPRLLLLDEPTSQLDPAGAAAVIDVITRLRTEEGLAMLLAEHRLDRALPVADRVVDVREGTAAVRLPAAAAALLASPPSICALGLRLGLEPLPLSPDEARAALSATGRQPVVRSPEAEATPGDAIISLRGLAARYGAHLALSGVDLDVRQGEVVALVGPNGSGKTTLFRAIAGTLAAEGSVHLAGAPAPRGVPARTAIAGFCPQDPGTILRHETVLAEVGSTLRTRRCGRDARAVLRDWGIDGLADRDPRDLSAGQRQRVATAAMLAHDPPAWLLDEPTRGADSPTRAWLTTALRRHALAGGCAVVATHDIEAAARFATRVVGLAEGRLAFDLPVRRALGSDGPCPTAVARAVPGAMVPEDVSW